MTNTVEDNTFFLDSRVNQTEFEAYNFDDEYFEDFQNENQNQIVKKRSKRFLGVIAAVVKYGLIAYQVGSAIKKTSDDRKLKRDIEQTLTQVNQNHYLLNQNSIAIGHNFGAIRQNGEATNRNYETIKEFEHSVNKNFELSMLHFQEIEHKLNEILSSIECAKVEIIDRIELVKAEILQSIKDSRTEPIISALNTFFNYFINEAKAINALPMGERIAKLEESSGILQYLKNSRTPQPGTLYSLLSDIINQRFAIPANKDDKMAIVMLELLCYGMQVYTSIIYFILHQYAILTENYYHKSDLDKYNKYYLMSLDSFKDFSNTLIDSNNGFLDKVTSVLNTVKNLPFIHSDRKDVEQFASAALDNFHSIKSALAQMSKSFDYNKPSKLETKPNFGTSNIHTPIDNWKNGATVSYAIQFLGNDTKISSMVSEWSTGYTIDDYANPIVKIPLDPTGRARVIFRKFDSEKPQIVGIVRDSTVHEYRDVNRELYNAAMQPNERVALKEIAVYLEHGADVNAVFENDKRAIHAAAENDNWEVALALIRNGSHVDVKDVDGHSPLYIATEAGFELFVQNLIQNSANVNIKTNKEHLELTPLHTAAFKGHRNIVHTLLQSKSIQVDVKSVHGHTPLHFAASFCNVDIVSALIADNRTVIDAMSDQLLTPLHLASINNCDKVVQTLAQSGKVDINAKAFDNVTPLHFASAYGSKEVVSELLLKGAYIEAQTVNGSTVVHYAAFNGNEDIVSSLAVNHELIVNTQNDQEITPLYVAFQYNNVKAASKLLEKCAHLNLRLSGHKTMLHLAASNGDADAVTNLVANKVPVSSLDDSNRQPLYYAVRNGHVQVANQLIVHHGASPDVKNADGKPILHLAVDLDELEALNMIKMLVQNKANINITDKFGNTLLHIAAKRGYLSIIKFGIEKGANVKTKNINNDTPLRLAKVLQSNRSDIASFLVQKSAVDSGDKVDFLDACHKGNLNLIKYLYEVRAVDVHMKNIDHQNGLFKAINGKVNLEIFKFLEKLGVNIHEIDAHKFTQVNYAAWCNKFDILQYLIEQGADFKSVNTSNNNALHYAASNNNFEMVKYLLHLGLNANINDKGFDGQTPLIYAVRYSGDLKLVKYLIKSGAKTNITDKNGKAALTWATEKNKLDIKQYLTQLPTDSKLKAQIDTDSLFFAAAQNNLQLVEQYLNKNISVNVKDEDDGQTPLYRAIYYNGQLDLTKFLHSKGADIKQFNATKSDNLVYLSVVKHKLDVTKYLIESGADFQTAGVSGNTPLHGAIRIESIDMLKYLLDKDAYNNHKNSAGKTPFDLLIEGRKDKLIKYLVFEYKDKQEQTMLHEAAFQGDNVNVKFLLERGAHVNAADKLKNTPLHLAAQNGHLETVKLLMQQICVNIFVKNVNDQTVLEVAQYNHKHDVVEFLNEQMKTPAGGSQFFSEPAKNSAAKATFFFSNIFNGFVGTLKSFAESMTQFQMPTLYSILSSSNAMPNELSPTENIDLNSTLFLFDVLARKYTGQQYFNANGRSVSSTQARIYSLTLVQQYEKLLTKLAINANIDVAKVVLECDWFSLYRTIERYMMSGQYSRIDRLLYTDAHTVLSSILSSSTLEHTIPDNLLIQMVDRLLIETHNIQRDNQIVATDSHMNIRDIVAKATQPKLIETNTKQHLFDLSTHI